MQDFSKRISIVVDESLPAWQAMNTLAHISANFGHYLETNFDSGKYFTAADSITIPRNCQYPIIIFKASPAVLQAFAKETRTLSDITPMYFIREMIDTSVDEEIVTSLQSKTFDQLEFLGVGLFGENALVKSYTKRFKLWS